MQQHYNGVSLYWGGGGGICLLLGHFAKIYDGSSLLFWESVTNIQKVFNIGNRRFKGIAYVEFKDIESVALVSWSLLISEI